jgi:hypothetical protein
MDIIYQYYGHLQDVRFKYLTVNNSMAFVGKETAYRTNTIEGMCGQAKILMQATYHIIKCLMPMHGFVNLCTDLDSNFYRNINIID